LEEVLDQLITKNKLEYKIYDNVIMVRKSKSFDDIVTTQNYKTSYHLKGKVFDSSESTAMAFASILLSNSTIGTYSDDEGNFDIEIPAEYADAEIEIQYLGYDAQRYKIKEAENTYLLVPLEVSAYNISEVMIVNREAEIKIGSQDQAMDINNTQVQNTTSGLAGNDLSRNLQLLPGINASDDTSAEIKIRGSNSDETLLILDGIPVYNPSHYYGIFSSINSNYIETINLYKNAFPIQYGGKTAGVVEMHSTGEIKQKPTLMADINLLTASLNLGLPITNNSSLFISGRSTIGNISNTKFNSFTSRPDGIIQTQNFFDNTETTPADPNFNFQDINAKYAWTPSDKTNLSLNFYSSNDDFSIDSDLSSQRRPGQIVGLSNEQTENWNNLGASAVLSTELSRSINFDGRIFFSKYSNKGLTDLNIKNNRARFKEIRINASQYNTLSDLGLNFMATKSIGKNKISLGMDAVHHNVAYQFQENNRINIDGDDKVSEITPYAAYNMQLTNKLNINLGIRSSFYEGTGDLYFSPRLMANYALSDWIKLKSSYSKNQQFLRELNYEYRGQLYELWVHADQENIPIIESNNFMVGSTVRFGNFILDVEAFYKDMTGMLEYAVVNPTGQPGDQPPGQSIQDQQNFYELFTGNGRSQGIDVLLSATFKNYDTYLSYTLSKIEHSFAQIQRGNYFASEDDRTHQLKWINEYHLGDFSFGANWIFSTGRLYTDLSAFSNNEDIRDIPANRRNKRLPSYQRLDLSTAYGFKFGEHKASIGLSLFNALDHQNVKYEQLIESRPQDNEIPLNTVVGTTTNLLNRTLNLSFKINLN